MFWFLVAAMVVVIAAVTLAVLGSGDGSGGPVTGGLPEAEPDRIDDPLPLHRPVLPADVVAVRLPVAPRGYRMAEVDEVLDRLAAEIAERDARIAELETALAETRLTAPREESQAGGSGASTD
ncbi:DivIVA domain-containing protein [Streptomyces sp. 4N509B]|uniref:DivIVA domain-containing protein n=1 Tax=Streptomyces sp. 4N509B TaxID=3457413 RepID=UPI003FD329D1